MSKAQPNFRVGDLIQQWLSVNDEYALSDMKDYYDSHPRKFRATLAWAVGRDSEAYVEVLLAVKTQTIEVMARVNYGD